ncbi:MAG TPA: methyltransferase domain-containing protein [Verrucomicrobiota bacterium]|nr:methyltransferase domain-containing protein [Verrucomicrobiota bacterium]
MKWFDCVIRNWRIRKALPHLDKVKRVLDVGCGDGTLMRRLAGDDFIGVGVDPRIAKAQGQDVHGVQFVRGNFPDDLPVCESFEVVAMLAVIEHVPEGDKADWASACHRLLVDSGRVVLTVPSPRVDAILAVLRFFRLADGTALEEHHGFDPGEVPRLFESAGFSLVMHKTFQLGLNNLFVFRKNA